MQQEEPSKELRQSSQELEDPHGQILEDQVQTALLGLLERTPQDSG